MFLICVYLIVLVVIIILFLYSRKEGFETLVTTSTGNQTTSTLLPTTSVSLYEMDEIDFSESEDSEKLLREEQWLKLNNCIGKYVNRGIKPLRDVSEIMFSKVEDCDNIFEATEVDLKKKYFEQMEYW